MPEKSRPKHKWLSRFSSLRSSRHFLALVCGKVFCPCQTPLSEASRMKTKSCSCVFALLLLSPFRAAAPDATPPFDLVSEWPHHRRTGLRCYSGDVASVMANRSIGNLPPLPGNALLTRRQSRRAGTFRHARTVGNERFWSTAPASKIFRHHF